MNDKMSLYNFYIDKDLKLSAQEKLIKELGKTEKGALSALIRVLIREYVDSPTDSRLVSKIAKEYINSATRNKRSRL